MFETLRSIIFERLEHKPDFVLPTIAFFGVSNGLTNGKTHIGAEELTSDDVKFGRCCFGAFFFEKLMMQNCTDTDKEQFCIIHF
jgi:hypothetical protein